MLSPPAAVISTARAPRRTKTRSNVTANALKFSIAGLPAGSTYPVLVSSATKKIQQKTTKTRSNVTANALKFSIAGLPAGSNYPVLVSSATAGLAQGTVPVFTQNLGVTAFSTSTSALYGGQTITIKGYGFASAQGLSNGLSSFAGGATCYGSA